MSGTAKPTSVVSSGSQKSTGKRLRAWEIAVRQFRLVDGRVVNVEQATDAEFQQFVNNSGVAVDENGIAEWTFDDRIGFINFALMKGAKLPFVEEDNSAEELLEASESPDEHPLQGESQSDDEHPSHATPEAEEEEISPQVQQAVKRFFDALLAGVCPECGAIVEQRTQIGMCVYAHPCGHRLYRGNVVS